MVPRPVVDVGEEASTVELREKQDTLVTLYLEDRERGLCLLTDRD